MTRSPIAPKRSRSPASAPKGRARFRSFDVLALAALLVLPSLALSNASLPLNAQWIAGWSFAASVFTFFAYRSDKRCAEAGAWRTSESTLQLMALLGGWPGAFVAQRAFRHKTSKISFQAVFWLIVLAQEFVALDSLLNWRLSKAGSAYLAA